jgi:hypothetical protein
VDRFNREEPEAGIFTQVIFTFKIKKQMKQVFIFALCSSLLFSCKPEPREYFDQATLNMNSFYGFAGTVMQREFASPSVKLVNVKTLESAPMTRAEVLEQKLTQLEAAYKKVKGLPMNDDAKEMITASLALFDYTLPVYKNEYKELAALYDSNAGADKIAELEKMINEKYEPRFIGLYNTLLDKGQAYAKKHGIEVQVVNPSPRL